MILPFKEQFAAKIIDGTKIHSIRKDEHDRWKPGKIIHMATGVRTPKYKLISETPCISVQWIGIDIQAEIVTLWLGDNNTNPHGGSFAFCLNEANLVSLAVNDGFENIKEFFDFFRNQKSPDGAYKLIHWTHLTYPIDFDLPM